MLLFKEIVDRTANLVALWQCVGFVHGVNFLIIKFQSIKSEKLFIIYVIKKK